MATAQTAVYCASTGTCQRADFLRRFYANVANLGHGIGANDMVELKPDTYGYGLECLDELWTIVRSGRYRFVVGGHTHVPMVREIESGTFINPGTLVMAQEPGFMLVDFDARRVERWTLLPQPALAETYAL